MFKKIATATTGILFLISAAGYAAASQGKGPGTAGGQQISTKTRSQVQNQNQVSNNCDGPQIKTQKRNRTNYSK